MILVWIASIVILLCAGAAAALIRSRNLHIWLPAYLARAMSPRNGGGGKTTHLYFSLVDHFEPFTAGASREKALKRVEEWCARYPAIAGEFSDADGNHPKHTIFYPQEAYDPEITDMLAARVKEGHFDFEIHLHHDDDTEASFRQKLVGFKETLFDRHGLLRKDPSSGEIIYGFIHGNWALDNSRRDGRMCGVNNELTVLKETGCYADFTLPSAPSDTQTAKINSIYYATDDPQKPKSHNTGVDAARGKAPVGDLLLIQGPLTLNWKKRRFFFMPGIENGDVCSGTEASLQRIRLWVENAPSVRGEPDIKFLKVFTHGCQDPNLRYLLNGGLRSLYSGLCENYNDGKRFVLHFVSPYEMYLKIKEIERD